MFALLLTRNFVDWNPVSSVTEDEDGVTLRHAFHCPAFHLAADDLDRIPTDIKTRGVGIGVVVLLTSSDDRVLLTRRAEHMRTFPGTWVKLCRFIFLPESKMVDV